MLVGCIYLKHCNRAIMHCNNISFQQLLDCYHNELENKINACNLDHNKVKLLEIVTEKCKE